MYACLVDLAEKMFSGKEFFPDLFHKIYPINKFRTLKFDPTTKNKDSFKSYTNFSSLIKFQKLELDEFGERNPLRFSCYEIT